MTGSAATRRSRTAAEKKLMKMPVTDAARTAAWAAYKNAPAQQALRAEFDQKTVSTGDRTSPYLWRHVGEKPAGGWGLVIAMHGGGNAPKEVNDGEWKYMFSTYYKEHPEAGGYVYLALRAPNDTWNGFYDDSICPLDRKTHPGIRDFRRREPGQSVHDGRVAWRLWRIRDWPEGSVSVRRDSRRRVCPDGRRNDEAKICATFALL